MRIKSSHKAALAALLLSSTGFASLQATEGYFQTAYGARHSALAGAGLAYVTDSTGLGLNPAGIAGLGRGYNVGLKIFSPRRQTVGSGQPGLTPLGTVESGRKYFFIPNLSYVAPAGDKGTWGVGIFANGGMNTSYAAVDRDIQECGGGTGVFCGGKAGVDLIQAFVTAGYAHQVTDNLKLGVSAKLAVQRFKARGIAPLAGFSQNPEAFTNNGYDWSTGFGVQVGATYTIDQFSIAATYQPKIKMSKFDDYAGLFAEGGDFDIPETFSAGVAYHVNDRIHLMADYRRVNYSDVASVGNPSTAQAPFGSAGGPGFGWGDVDSVKFGVEIEANEKFTYRFGVGFNENPISGRDVTLNVLAPGVVKEHYAAGFSYKTSEKGSLNFSATYVPYHQVSGNGMVNPNHQISIGMKQYMTTVEWSYKF